MCLYQWTIFISFCSEAPEDTKYQTAGTILRIEDRASNFHIIRTSRRSFLQYTFLCRKYAPLCLARLIILSRRLDVTRIFIATDSIFSPEWRSPRSNFTRAAPAPLWHPPPALSPLTFLLRRCLILALHPYVPRADPPDRTNFHEITLRLGAQARRTEPTDNYFRW